MTEKFQNVFVTGDLHLGDRVFNNYKDSLILAVKENKFDCLVFGGDTFDPWRGQSIEDLLAEYWELFDELQRLNGKVVFLRGNHDMDIDVLKKFGFAVTDQFSYVNAENHTVRVVHGHEFDKVALWLEFLSRKLVYLEEKINAFLSMITDECTLRLLNLVGSIDMERVLSNFYLTLEKYKIYDTLLFGHTHVPWQGKADRLNFYNWGSWQNHFNLKPSYLVDAGGGLRSVHVD